MKKLIGAIALCGVLALVGVASATTTNELQPASSGGVGYFDSLHVGEPGIGGVTYFNGSIVNESDPVTIADDLRVDGAITRGFGPVKVADDVVIQGDLTVEGTAYIGASTIASHWLNSDGVQANYVLRIPHKSEAPGGSCETGNLYGDVSSGSAGLYLCNDSQVWETL